MIRVFPRRTKWTPTDDLAFVGEPPLFLPPDQPVYVSVCFTWDIEEGRRLQRAWADHYATVLLGGPALGHHGDQFTPGQFVKSGVTITSRGCPNKCPWCFVWRREGSIRELEIKDGWIVIDSNLLACSEKHIDAVFAMLRRQPEPITFCGGFEANRFNQRIRDLLDTIRLKEVWFACDTPGAIHALRKIVPLLEDLHPHKRRCYVMIGRGEDLKDAERRLQEVFAAGFLPFAQLYRGPDEIKWPQEWKDLARYWSRPAIYRSKQQAKAND